MDKLKSRKFWIAIGLIASATVVAGFGKITPDQWIETVKWVGVGYFSSQGLADAAGALKK